MGAFLRITRLSAKPGYLPEIFSLGHRSPQGLAMQPSTGLMWENEHGQQGGDELNIIRAGKNYGWPLATFGINYDGEKHGEPFPRADLEPPFAYWVPSIAISGLMFYTGDKFPAWKDNVFVGGMFQGRTRGTGQVQRIVLSAKGQPIQREPLLVDLHQRIRDVRQGPDGLVYVLTEEPSGRAPQDRTRAVRTRPERRRPVPFRRPCERRAGSITGPLTAEAGPQKVRALRTSG